MEEEGELYKLQAYLIVAGGLVILLTAVKWIQILLKKEKLPNRLSVPYTAFFLLLMGLMVAFRNQRDWVSVMAVIFLVFYLRMWSWEKSDRILSILGNGLILNFFKLCKINFELT